MEQDAETPARALTDIPVRQNTQATGTSPITIRVDYEAMDRRLFLASHKGPRIDSKGCGPVNVSGDRWNCQSYR